MATVAELFNQALQSHVTGNVAQAEQIYRQILQIAPTFANAHANLGVILRQRQQPADAIGHLEQAIRHDPNHALSHFNLGLALLDQGRFADAATCQQRALQLAPNFADAHYQFGNALYLQGQLAAAAECYRQAVQLQPEHADAHYNLGRALHDLGQPADAIPCYRRALELKPAYVEALNNLGNALRDLSLVDEAIPLYEQALRLQPNYALTHNNLGNGYREQGKLDSAAICYREALRLVPDYAEAHVNLGMLRFLQGRFEDGYSEYEWRFRTNRLKFRTHPQPLWDGSALAGKTILLQAEQGFGDTLQFIRYAPLVKARGGAVFLECPPELMRILRTCAGIDEIFPSDSAIPPFDVRMPLLSLPAVFKTTLTTIPASIPYLHAAPTLVEKWRESFSGEPPTTTPALNVGIVWQGNPRFAQAETRSADQKRSLALAQFEPLARVPGVRLYSLQKGYGTEQLAEWQERWQIVELGGKLGDFMDTAAVMMNLDLVITADTAPAHLAGALGVPVWNLLYRTGCWRWLQDREDTPWYPTMRLFRQKRHGDWGEVMERVATEAELIIKRSD
jgi:tetratricopeptide (TPR) repeat protein